MSEAENINLFVNWLDRNGFNDENLSITSFSENEGRGITAKKQFVCNEILLKIPENLIITSDTVFRSDLKHALLTNSGLLQPFDALCLFIICEKLKGTTSKWSPYINVLPSSYSNPITILDSDSSSVFPPKVKELFLAQINEVNNVKRRVKTVFEAWASDIHPKNGYEFSETLFLWAWATVNTRCIFKANTLNDVYNNIEGDSLALVPFLDMLNHDPDPKIIAKFSKLTKCYELILMGGAVVEGSELFISYGPHSNIKLFLEYGFVLKDNPNNVINFDIDDFRSILNNDKTISEKHWSTLLAAQLNCCVYSTQLEPSWNFMSVFSLLNLPENQLPLWKKIYSISNPFDDVKSVEMAKYFLNSYLRQLKEKLPSEADFNKISIPDYSKECLLQLWNDELFIVSQCLEQF